ncbi:MAG: DUF2946 domain-containing protein [Zoogloeaceae bacterium]|jgi:hypothetical protein|nr:DUF2946 domain-containing protein [Zoogloeaceae bacterium]
MRFHVLRSPRFAVLALFLIALRLVTGPGGVWSGEADTRLGEGNSSVVICTAAGMATVEAPGMPTEPARYPMGPHCPFCLTGSASFALPNTDFSFPLPELAAAKFLPPVAAGFQPRPLETRHAPKRAPPAFSFA